MVRTAGGDTLSRDVVVLYTRPRVREAAFPFVLIVSLNTYICLPPAVLLLVKQSLFEAFFFRVIYSVVITRRRYGILGYADLLSKP